MSNTSDKHSLTHAIPLSSGLTQQKQVYCSSINLWTINRQSESPWRQPQFDMHMRLFPCHHSHQYSCSSVSLLRAINPHQPASIQESTLHRLILMHASTDDQLFAKPYKCGHLQTLFSLHTKIGLNWPSFPWTIQWLFHRYVLQIFHHY